MSGLRTWSWQICLPKDFIWARLAYLWAQILLPGRKSNLLDPHSQNLNSKPPSLRSEMIENDLNESLSQLRMISPDDDSSAHHAQVTAEFGREEMRSPLNWTRHQNLRQTEICNKIRLFSPFSFRVSSQLSVTCSWASLPRSSQWVEMSLQTRRRVTRPITKHSYNEYQTEIPLMGEIEIPRRSFLVNEQVDVY